MGTTGHRLPGRAAPIGPNRAASLIAAAALLAAPGCATWQPLTPSTPESAIVDHPVRIALRNDILEIRPTHVRQPFLYGQVKDGRGEPQPVTIHLDALKPGQALVRTYSKKTEMGLAIGIGGAAAAAMLAAMVFAISTADPTPSSGDCWCF